jgi:hypothetical protein
LGKTGSGIFLQMGLDYPNQIDPVKQIRLSAQGGLAQRVRTRRGRMTGSGVIRLFIVGERRITLR